MRYASVFLLSLAAAFSWAHAYQSPGTSQIIVRGQTYYYSGGCFYRLGKSGYMRVKAPVGARVASIPGDSGTITMGGERYFVTRSGTVFRYDPSGRDYVVAKSYGWREYSREARSSRPASAPLRPQYEKIPRAYPGYRKNYNGYWDYYGRYGFRDDIYDESYRERKATCRRIARDQSRRDKVGPYRRQPGSYWDEYARCMR